jgi:hypothetical protein
MPRYHWRSVEVRDAPGKRANGQTDATHVPDFIDLAGDRITSSFHVQGVAKISVIRSAAGPVGWKGLSRRACLFRLEQTSAVTVYFVKISLYKILKPRRMDESSEWQSIRSIR